MGWLQLVGWLVQRLVPLDLSPLQRPLEVPTTGSDSRP